MLFRSEGKVNKKVAAQLTEFMYRNPDAAIDAIEKARQRAAARQVFTGRAGRATAATAAQAAESTGNVLRELTGAGQESENALAR